MKRVHEIDDGGETSWYVTENEGDARGMHVQLFYINAGIPVTGETLEEIYCRAVEDDKPLTMTDADKNAPAGEPVTHTAAEWAGIVDGFLGTTAL